MIVVEGRAPPGVVELGGDIGPVHPRGRARPAAPEALPLDFGPACAARRLNACAIVAAMTVSRDSDHLAEPLAIRTPEGPPGPWPVI